MARVIPPNTNSQITEQMVCEHLQKEAQNIRAQHDLSKGNTTD